MAVRFDRNTKVPASHASAPGTVSAIDGGSRLPLRVRYHPPSPVIADQYVLAEISFGANVVAPANSTHPTAAVTLPSFGHDPQRELWTSDLPVTYGQRAGIRYATNDELLFGIVDEASDVAGADFEERVRATYETIFEITESQRYPHLLRVWNYFPSMNLEFDRLENYQRFCRARSLAFQNYYNDFVYRLPSASAIGTPDGAFTLYFIAARSPGVHRENPRQLSAYSYPPQYGPRSPSFARATLKRFDASETFFISGTASIVGHESLHPGDVGAQTDEALNNIEALIDAARSDEPTWLRHMQDLDNVKVYLRRAQDLGIVRATMERRINPSAQILYLQGDICRRELLVEIEATLYAG